MTFERLKIVNFWFTSMCYVWFLVGLFIMSSLTASTCDRGFNFQLNGQEYQFKLGKK